MFGIHLRQLYRTCDKVIIRNLRSRRLDTSNPNPGLNKRIKAFEAEGLRVKDENLEEFVEQSESDFYKVGEAYNEHLNETLMGKYEVRHHIVKEKYFKENMPNLLTWSEKEQIRHLVNTQPDEWTLEKIAQSFPVTVPVVKKLLKFPWKPATEQRIARHDASVMRNWRELKEGSLDIPPEIRKHFLTFSNRSIPPLRKESIKVDLTPEEDLGEFERIVRKCAAKENQNNSTDANTENLALPNTDSSNTDEKPKKKRVDPKLVTLDELTMKIKKRLDQGSNVDINDRIMMGSVKESRKNESVSEHVQRELELYNDTVKENSIVEYKDKADNPKEVMNYPERIRIPKKAYKRGATYKVNDCYYDDDGRFLYRVLGMTQ